MSDFSQANYLPQQNLQIENANMDIETGSSAGDTLAAIVITNELSQTQEGAQNEKVCANCGATLSGAYCHACGQSAHIHRSLLHMVEELLHGLFHFDTKAWRTIPALIFRPGKLTRDYIAGKRTSYVSPLALFLFLIFLMFFVFSYTMDDTNNNFLTVTNSREDIVAEIATAQSNLSQLQTQASEKRQEQESDSDLPERIHEGTQQLRILQDKLNDLDEVVVNKTELESEIARLRTTLNEITIQGQGIHASDSASQAEAIALQKRFIASDLRYAEKRLRRVIKNERKTQTKQAAKSALKAPSASAEVHASATASTSASSETSASEHDTDVTHFKASDLPEYPMLGNLLESANKDPKFTLYKMKKNAASLAFLLIPISLPFLWLLFAFRRQFVMFDHAVFSLYSLSFISVLLMLIAILAKLEFKGTAALLFTLAPPVHMFSQLRHAYQLTRFEAVWRTIALLFIAFTSLLAYAMMVTLFSA